MLEKDVVADRVDKRSQAVRLAKHSPFPQRRKHSREGLLAHIFDRLRGPEPRPQLQVEQLREITHEMLLRGEVTCAEILNVSCVERVELQWFLQNSGGRKYTSRQADNKRESMLRESITRSLRPEFRIVPRSENGFSSSDQFQFPWPLVKVGYETCLETAGVGSGRTQFPR